LIAQEERSGPLSSILIEILHKPVSSSKETVYPGCHIIPPGMQMEKQKIFNMKFSRVYPLYIQKAERKNRTKEEVDQIIRWLTGYDQVGLQKQIEKETDFESFFAQAPGINPNSSLIKGVVCGVRVEEIKDPLMQKIRYLDKLVDELAKGKSIEKILRK